jgi:hypothetical protein
MGRHFRYDWRWGEEYECPDRLTGRIAEIWDLKEQVAIRYIKFHPINIGERSWRRYIAPEVLRIVRDAISRGEEIFV